MKFHLSVLLLLSIFFSFSSADTITVNGQTVHDCELVEIATEGPIYRDGGGEFHILPWEQLTPIQKNLIRTQHNAALVNAMCDGRYVKGTVFHANKDGVIIQIELGNEIGTNGYKDGAKVVTAGLVLIKDLPIDVPRSTGDPIEIIGYYDSKGDFDMGIAKKEIDFITIAKPEWFSETEWTNSAGAKMSAKLLGMKDGKVLFLKGGQRMVIDLSALDAESQEKAKKINERLAKYPVP